MTPADNDGWIEWGGGDESPIPNGVRFKVHCAWDSRGHAENKPWYTDASVWTWRRRAGILAYKTHPDDAHLLDAPPIDWSILGPEAVEALRSTLALALVKWGNVDSDANVVFDQARAVLAKLERVG